MPTGWTATWGAGKPVIALGSDIDDIPQASQKPGVAYHDPIVAGAPGHGEGHNSGMPLQVTAALAVKKIMEREHLSGTLKLWPGVAEELGGGKAYFVRAGVVQGRRHLPVHARRQQLQRVVGRPRRHRRRLGGVHVQGRERARGGESVARPLGARRRRADGHRLELPPRAPAAVSSGRTTSSPTAAISPTSCPSNASVWYYFREIDYPHIKELREIGDTMAKAAAMMTNTEVDVAGHRRRVAAALQQGRRRDDVREHQGGRPAEMERRRHQRWPGRSRRKLGQPPTRAGGGDRAAAGPGPAGGQPRRRLRRHRRRVVERADRDAELPVEHSRHAGPQLGERRVDGDADRAQGRRPPARR